MDPRQTRCLSKMARPESRDRGSSIQFTVGKLVTHRHAPHKVRRTNSGSGVNQNNLNRIKRRRLDSETARAVKDDLMLVMKADVEAKYAKLHREVYFKPPVHFNRVRLEDSDVIRGTVKVLTPASQLSDVREDESMQRVHWALSEMLRAPDDGPMFLLFSLDFDNYLNDADSLAKARQRQRRHHSKVSEEETRIRRTQEKHLQTSQPLVQFFSDRRPQDGSGTEVTNATHDHELDLSAFNRPRDLEAGRQRGRFDILVIHPQRGFMIFKVKAIGDAFYLGEGPQTQTEQLETIRVKLKKALNQLNKEEEVLRYLVSDLNAEDAPVTKGLMLPNLKKQTARLALLQDSDLQKKFIDALGEGTDIEKALEKCIFSDQLPPMGQSLDTTDDVILNLRRDWWDKLVNRDSGYRMNEQLYEALVARFCGPATSQLVRTRNGQYADVSTLPRAVKETANCFSQTVVTQQQVTVLSLDHGRVYLTGPPGTGKSVVLTLKAEELARQGQTVLITSFWSGSKVASQILHHQIKQNLSPFSKPPSLCICESSRLEDILVKVLDAADPARSDHKASRTQNPVLPRSSDENDDIAMDCPSGDDGSPAISSKHTVSRKQNPVPLRLSYKPDDYDENASTLNWNYTASRRQNSTRLRSSDDDDDDIVTDCLREEDYAPATSRNYTAFRKRNSTRLRPSDEDDDYVGMDYPSENNYASAISRNYTSSRTQKSTPLRSLEEQYIEDDDLVTDCPTEDIEPTVGSYHTHAAYTIHDPIPLRLLHIPNDDDDNDLVTDCPIEDNTPTVSGIHTNGGQAVRTTGNYQFSPPLSYTRPAGKGQSQSDFKKKYASTAGQIHSDFHDKPTALATPRQSQADLKKKVNATAEQNQPDLKKDKVYIFVDEAPWFLDTVVHRLEASLGKDGFVLWAASSFPPSDPKSYHQVTLTQSLRSPPVVVRELQAMPFYRTFQRHPYTSLDTGVIAGLPSPTNGPRVKTINHQEHTDGGKTVWDCQQCGLDVAEFLLVDLHIMESSLTGEDSETNPPLRFSDVLISGYNVPRSADTKFITALISKGVPVDFHPGQGTSDRLAVFYETDAVQVAEPECVLGLERPVVVAMGTSDVRETCPRYVDPWYDVISRCTSQLVVVGEPELSLRDMMKSLWLPD